MSHNGGGVLQTPPHVVALSLNRSEAYFSASVITTVPARRNQNVMLLSPPDTLIYKYRLVALVLQKQPHYSIVGAGPRYLHCPEKFASLD